jgi:hypothetical protein
MSEIHCDVLIVGGSLGGVAAALRAATMGAQVCLVTETDWMGGQLTSQGVCTPDENPWIETTGCTLAYRDFRRRAREHYRRAYRLSAKGKRQARFNAGNNWVNGTFAVEPLVALALLREMLAPFSNLTVLTGTQVVQAEVAGDTVTSLGAVGPGGAQTRFFAPMVLDATDLGNLLPLAGVEHQLGSESKAETGEPDAPDEPRPEWVQPFTFPFALERRAKGENHTITPPPDYAELKELQQYTLADGAIKKAFREPNAWWTYRRFIDASNFRDPAFPRDRSMINTKSNDFNGGTVPSRSAQEDAEILARGKRASLGYLYWLQTECPRDEGGTGYPELRLVNVFGTADGLAPDPYIREGRRIKALTTVRQQDISAKANPGPRAVLFPDSCGIGSYAMDIHTGGISERWRDGTTKPFQIPLGALIPVRMTNLLAACKNLGVTHQTNGAYRVHPVEWAIGEAAGALAAFCIANRTEPRAVHGDPARLRSYRHALLEAGIPLFWWSDVPVEHPAFAAAQLLGLAGLFHGYDDLTFRPDAPLTPSQQQLLAERAGRVIHWPKPDLTRGEGAVVLARELGL